MPNIDEEWLNQQLQLSKTDKKTADVIKYLMDGWSKLNVSNDKVIKEAVEKFSKLAVGVPIYVPVEEQEVWVPAMPGRLSVGDTVLVKSDAFEGELGQIHNGRRGRIVAVRYGDIIVNSTDGIEPALVGSHYSPFHLLKLERG